MEFMGHTTDFWQELKRRFDNAEPETAFRRAELLDEVIKLRAHVAFYESRIKEMARLSRIRSAP